MTLQMATMSVHQDLLKLVNGMDASTDVSVNYVMLDSPQRNRGDRHPSYLDMIKKAICALNEGGMGCSKASILKYIAENYQLGDSLPKINGNVRNVMKMAMEKGEIEQVRRPSCTEAPHFCTSPTSSPKSDSEKFPFGKRSETRKTAAEKEREKQLQVQIPIKLPIPDLAALVALPTKDVNAKKEDVTANKRKPIGKKRTQTKKSAPRVKKVQKKARRTTTPPPTKMILRSSLRSHRAV